MYIWLKLYGFKPSGIAHTQALFPSTSTEAAASFHESGGDLDLDLLRDGERDLHLGPPLLPLALPLLPPGLFPLGEGDLECLPSGFPRVLDVTPLVANDSGNFIVSA